MFHIFGNFDISSTLLSLDLSILPLQFRLLVSSHTHTPLINLFGRTQFYLDTIAPFRNTRSHSVRHRHVTGVRNTRNDLKTSSDHI
ncbi:hypothetical protein Hanom_Chr04g00307981 [Helianthus anomalus]